MIWSTDYLINQLVNSTLLKNVKGNRMFLHCQTEVYDDPSSVQPPPVPYQQTPQVFLFSRPATAHLDLDTATALAWRLRGLASMVLVHRCILFFSHRIILFPQQISQHLP